MININRILCPTDLTPHSGNALRYALALSRTYEAELVLLYCESGSQGATAKQKLGVHKAELLESVLFEQINHSDLIGLQWRTLVVETDDVGEEIRHIAEAEGTDLIVMRSRRRPHRAALLGSTAEAVSRRAPCPVLVMHGDEHEWVRDGLEIALKRILVAYDFSDYSEVALNYGLSIAQEHQAELHLLHVLPPRSVNDPEIAWYPIKGESAYHNAARRLQRAVPAEAHLWCKIKHVVSEGHAYREILNYAENNEIDLISVGAHGAGFGMRALFGSNVDRVLRQARCPVLVARPLRPRSFETNLQSSGSTRDHQLAS
jgi:nucleotide-binding universal stress UspA family protein